MAYNLTALDAANTTLEYFSEINTLTEDWTTRLFLIGLFSALLIVSVLKTGKFLGAAVSASFVTTIVSFLFYALLQGIVFKNIILFEYAFCFIYIYYLLSLPVDIRPVLAILIGFGMGLIVDMFYDTGGIHAASSVLLMFEKSGEVHAMLPTGGRLEWH